MVVACVITARKVFYFVNPDAFDRMFFDRQNSGMWFSVELLQNCPVLELRHLFIIQWNLDVTNLYVTKFSV